MDLNQLFKMAGEMRDRLATLKDEAKNVRVSGEAGGGLVRVVVNGSHEVLEVHIDPKAMVESERALLEDLVRAAVNQANSQVGDALKDRVAALAKQLGLDPSMLSGGLGGLGL